MKKRDFKIVKTDDGRYNIAVRIRPNSPLDRNGFDTKRDARKRLNEYLKKVKEYEQ